MTEPHLPETQPGTRSPYRHQTLRRTHDASLRLLRVLSARHDGRIQVQLWQSDRSTEYRCLSYMWGEPTSDHEILLDECTFCVRDNLYKFLELASQQFPNEPLWIDAICIDQSNDVEKAEEVRRMNEIYTGAKEVLVWLGDGSLLDSTVKWMSLNPREECTTPVQTDIERLIRHPYWNRTWITQELLLARKLIILFGTHLFDWTEFGPASIAALDSHYMFESHHVAFFWERWTYGRQKACESSAGKAIYQPITTFPFWDLFSWRGTTQCTDPRDRIYGLLALVREETDLFPVSYTENVADLFWRVGTHFNAWILPGRVASLMQSLSLEWEDIIDAAPKRISLPIIHAGSPSSPQIAYVRGDLALLCTKNRCRGSVLLPSNAHRKILLCIETAPHTNEFSDTHMHCLITLADSVTGSRIKAKVFLPYFPRNYQHKDRPLTLPQPALQVCENVDGSATWLNIEQISVESQEAFVQDVNTRSYRYRLHVPSTFITEYVKELLVYQHRLQLQLERSLKVRERSPSPTYEHTRVFTSTLERQSHAQASGIAPHMMPSRVRHGVRKQRQPSKRSTTQQHRAGRISAKQINTVSKHMTLASGSKHQVHQ